MILKIRSRLLQVSRTHIGFCVWETPFFPSARKDNRVYSCMFSSESGFMSDFCRSPSWAGKTKKDS